MINLIFIYWEVSKLSKNEIKVSKLEYMDNLGNKKTNRSMIFGPVGGGEVSYPLPKIPYRRIAFIYYKVMSTSSVSGTGVSTDDIKGGQNRHSP